MSMQDLAPNPDVLAEDEALLEAELEQELAAISADDCLQEDEEKEEQWENVNEAEDPEPLPESITEYLERSKSRTEQIESVLDGVEQLIHHTAKDPSDSGLNHLKSIAEESGEDPTVLRNRVLEDLEKEELEDIELRKTLANETVTQDDRSVTLPDINTENHTDQNYNCVDITDEPHDQSFHTPDTETCPDTSTEHTHYPNMEYGGGVVALVMESDTLERQGLQQIWKWEKEKDEQADQRKQEEEIRTKEELQKLEDIACKRQQRQLEISEEKDELAKRIKETEEKTQKEAEDFQKRFQESMQKYEEIIHQLSTQNERERVEFAKAQEEEAQKRGNQRIQAAVTIQAAYRRYRVYKIHGCTVKNRLLARKVQIEQDRVKAIEEARNKIELEEKRKEDERLKKEEDERKRRLEEKRRMEEKMQKEENERKEKLREEQEKKRKEEERKQIELKRLEEEKETRRQEEEKRNLELQQLEEEKRKEEQRKREEAESKMKEEERNKEEAERKMKEERRKEDDKNREEAERKLKEEKRKEAERMQYEGRMLEEEREKQGERATTEGDWKEENERKTIEGKEIEDKVLERLQEEQIDKEDEMERKQEQSKIDLNQGITTAVCEKQLDMKYASKSQGALKNGLDLCTQQQNVHCDAKTAEIITKSDIIEKQTPLSARGSDISLSLPDSVEQSRLTWMKECKPWSKIMREEKNKRLPVNKGPLRRPVSGKKVSPLSEAVILTAAKVSSLQQVTTVELHDLPGCSISSLAQCKHLRTLIVNHCGLLSVEGLNPCTHLRYVDLKNNAIESINLRDMSSLVYVEMSHNSLSSIHGLEGCANLRLLSLAHNRITRISGLETLRNLHTLEMSHNQLITCDKLCEAPSIQRLDISHNHLSKIGDLNRLALLEVLNVAGNNLIQVPSLTNHVLLSYLMLENNSLNSLHGLARTWLPQLHTLSLAQNSLYCLDSLATCVLLQTLDIGHNQILDLKHLLPGISTCRNLSCLKLEGNPVTEEPKCRSMILDAVPSLRSLDDGPLSKQLPYEDSAKSLTCFESVCAAQLEAHKQLRDGYINALQSTVSPEEKYHIHCQYFNESRKLAEDHRYVHEYGEVSPDSVPRANADFSSCKQTSLLEKPKSADITSSKDKELAKSKFEQALVAANVNEISESKHHVLSSPRITNVSARVVGKLLGSEDGEDVLGLEFKAAVKIQALWRGYCLRRDIDRHAQWCLSDKSAIKIQAMWRGYQLRKRLQYAFDFARCDEEVEKIDDVYGEVDLSAFDFNEDDLEKGWTPPATPHVPASYAVIGKYSPKPPEGKPPMPPDVPPLYDKLPQPPLDPPHHPKHAWRNLESPMSESSVAQLGKPPLPPLSQTSETHRSETTHKTHGSKQELLSEEWGFKDKHTAELMMQRARKLKYNAQRKKKLGQLDPHQRLALFRKLDEAKLKPVVPPARKQAVSRKEYFQAREEEDLHREREKVEENNQRISRTFEWVHTQVGSYDVGSSRINPGLAKGGFYSSDSNLPHMDPSVLAGGRALLTGSPVSMELQSVESVSTHGDHSSMVRRHSMSERDTGGSAVQLPPIKTSSAPISKIKERLSWRSPQVDKSVGWGGGKKRTRKS